MGRVSKNNPKPDESNLEQYYYHFLFKERTKWTNHVIPVRIKDPDTGFFIECYLKAPRPISDPKMEVVVESAMLPIYQDSTIYTTVDNIFPSKRLLTRYVGGFLAPITIDPIFNPVTLVPNTDVQKVFKTFPDKDFTINEIICMLNYPVLILEGDKISDARVEEVTERICLILGTKQKAFKLLKRVPIKFGKIPMESKQETDMISETLEQLYNCYKDCTNCSLGTERVKRGAGEPTFGRMGDVQIFDIKTIKKTIMMIGEAPGAQEEQTKISFFPEAPAGGALFKVIKASGIPLEACYFTNSVLCRPEATSPGTQNGKPSAPQITACSSRLKNEIAIIKPKVVAILGRTAYRAFFGREPENVLHLVGWQDPEKKIYFMPHPSFIQRELSFANTVQRAEIKTKYLAHFIEIKKKFDE